MKKNVHASLLVSSVLLLASCANSGDSKKTPDSTTVKVEAKKDTVPASPQPADSITVKAKFEITIAGDEANPKSVINVLVNGTKTKIKEISGTAEHYAATDFEKYQIPKNTMDACGAWWAGQGTYFYLTTTEKGVDVYEGWQAEEVSSKEGYHWKKVKSL